MLHHANLDRNKMSWMEANSDSAEYYYGFSTTGDVVSMKLIHGMSAASLGMTLSATVYDGIGLTDSIASNWGFTDSDTGLSIHTSLSALWTHAEALCYLQPSTAPYTYDTLA
jgi:hypothetical protein